ncbi:hypothetical protein [endosymbiont GvMRE of Glomus versiforme]|uniref:hypothetical protein n=1 Tax=endosymbiont GvMRE of Glomus versiforme TaxID=2039283 RepID=UPI001558D032|nr:hypothetical protein [endosymbiont GvMRE of Glomus versiforme]
MKKVISRRKIQLVCGQAKAGANLAFLEKKMVLFVKDFNNDEKAKKKNGELVNVEITIYEDGSYEYTIGNSPSSYLIKKAIGDKKEISQVDLEKIANEIMPSLNTDNLEEAKKTVASTVQSFGKKVSE